MIAIDTNIVVRLLVVDDVGQSGRARALVEAGPVFVPTSVLLETEWVLRERYGIERRKLTDALRRLLKLPAVVSEDRFRAMQSLDWADAGMDFADALHLAGSSHCDGFASFDRKLAKVSKRLGALPVMEP
jgi:predicted nucleic-acid-binding protein